MIIFSVFHHFFTFWLKAMSERSTAYNMVKQETQFVRPSTSGSTKESTTQSCHKE